MNVSIESHAHSHPIRANKRIEEFLNAQLRPGCEFSIVDEYPALFGDYPGGHSLVMRVGDAIAGHAGIVVREAVAGSARFKIGLIGSVVTAPQYREQRVATTLVRHALSVLKSRGCFVACLWSDEGAFYEPFGFVRAGREVSFRFSPQTLHGDTPSSNVFDERLHLNWIWRLYQKHALRVDRSLEEQRCLVHIPRSRIFVTEHKGEVTSYLVVHKGVDFTDYIHEWGGELSALRENIMGTQKHFFPDRPLTLIAPASYDLSQIRTLASEEKKGVLGLLTVLDKSLLLRLFANYLRGHGAEYRTTGNAFVFGKGEYPTETMADVVRLVFGGAGESKHPVLPFFLWGLDSI